MYNNKFTKPSRADFMPSGEVHQTRKFAHHVKICPNHRTKLGLGRCRRFSTLGGFPVKKMGVLVGKTLFCGRGLEEFPSP